MRPSFAQDIAPLFTDRDAHCMSAMGVELLDYAYMSDPKGDSAYADHANARHVLARLNGSETPRMPPSGPWSADRLDLLASWMRDWLP